MLEKTTPEIFITVFTNANIKYRAFVGYYAPRTDWDFYLTEDKLSGFAITKEKELVCLFNTNPNYKFLKDPEVVKFINENVDWFVCLGYYEYAELNDIECTLCKKSLVDYYTENLNFAVFGETGVDVEDMIESSNLIHTACFVKKYGLPSQTFLINRKYPILNSGEYGNNGYKVAKKHILMYMGFFDE